MCRETFGRLVIWLWEELIREINTMVLRRLMISVSVCAVEGVRKERIPGLSHYGGLREHVG
jgi:uncharacterized protein YicC (UPF0701 family)